MPRTARREHHQSLVRDVILDAATRIFARQGYAAVTMKDVAAEAGYTAPSLYNYFESKEQIFGALVDRLSGELLETFDEPMAAGMTFEQRLELLLRRQAEVTERHHDAFTIFTATGASEKLSKKPIECFHGYLGRLTSWIKDSSTPRERAGRDPATLALLLWGIGHAFRIRSYLSGRAGSLRDDTAVVLDLFFHGVGADGRRR